MQRKLSRRSFRSPRKMPTVDRSISWSAQSTTSSKIVGVLNNDQTGTNGSVVPTTRTRTGVRLPKWREIIEADGNATTGLTAQWDSLSCSYSDEMIIEETVSTSPSQWWKRVTTHKGYLPAIEYGAGCIRCTSPTASTTVAENRASAAFYKKLRSTAVQFSGPTFLGELRETLHMLRRPASALYSSAHGYLDALNHAKRASPKHWLKTVSGLWLEHSFGWMPLINDVKDAAKAQRRLAYPRQRVISAGGWDYADSTKSQAWANGVYAAGNGVAPGNHRAHRNTSHIVDTTIVRYKGKLKAQVEMTTWDNWALFGFTPSEFIPTAWELLPWSFLVDYFTNVGDILTSAVTCTNDVAFVNKTVIRQRKHTGFVVPYATPNTSPATKVVNIGRTDYVATRRLVTRSAGVSVPLPRLHFETGLSDGQLFNVAALLGQARALHGQNTPRNWHR